jgi:hypothetical protein
MRTKEDFDRAFTNPVTGEPYDVPEDIRAAAEQVILAYGIQGECDPMYVANVIAKHTGRGDGEHTFWPAGREPYYRLVPTRTPIAELRSGGYLPHKPARDGYAIVRWSGPLAGDDGCTHEVRADYITADGKGREPLRLRCGPDFVVDTVRLERRRGAQ